MHLWVLALCVVACLAVASVPGAEERSSPKDDAEILMRAVYSHVLGVPLEGEGGKPPAK